MPCYRDIFRNQRLPLAFVNLDKFDANVAYVAGSPTRRARPSGSAQVHSLRRPVRRIFAADPVTYRGLLTFTVEETAWLAAQASTTCSSLTRPSSHPTSLC
jgi:hypothetical protein